MRYPGTLFCSKTGADYPGKPKSRLYALLMTTPTPQTAEASEQLLYEGRPALVPRLFTCVLAVLTLGLYLIVRHFQVLGTHYRVTTRRVVIETGVFSKKMEQIDLYRITDYQVERPFGQRLFGTGNIALITVDPTSPRVEIREIKTDVTVLYEAIRTATEADRSRRGVRMVDYE